MSEAILLPIAVQAADDGLKVLAAALALAKMQSDSKMLKDADRQALIAIAAQVDTLMKEHTAWMASQ